MRPTDKITASLERLIENEDLGIEILHPGGLSLSTELLRLCGIRPGWHILEVASGTGETACLLGAEFGVQVTCLDRSDHLLMQARSKAQRRGLKIQWVRGDARALPFTESLFDAVICECALCAFDKLQVLGEMKRVARPGGVVGIHDLCWRAGAPPRLKERLREIEGEEPETLDGWQTLFHTAGLVSVSVHDRSDLIPEWIRSTRSQLGVLGYIRTAAIVFRRWGMRGLRNVLRSERIFADPHLGYALVVGRKG